MKVFLGLVIPVIDKVDRQHANTGEPKSTPATGTVVC